MEHTKPMMTEREWNDPELRKAALLRIHRKAERELAGTDKPLTPFLGEIGEQIREKRKAKALSLRQLQKLSGIDPSVIHKVEKGRLNVSICTLEKLAVALNHRLELNLIRLKQD